MIWEDFDTVVEYTYHRHTVRDIDWYAILEPLLALLALHEENNWELYCPYVNGYNDNHKLGEINYYEHF